MITTCICHACNWTDYELDGKNSIAHYADWTFAATTGHASLHVDHRPPNGGGAMMGPSAHCAAFDAAVPAPAPAPAAATEQAALDTNTVAPPGPVNCSARSGEGACEAAAGSGRGGGKVSGKPTSPCAFDEHIGVCCAANVSRPSPLGGNDCPCPVPCCAHQYNDPKISRDAVKAYAVATRVCEDGPGGQFCYPDKTAPRDVGCCQPQGDEPTGPMPPWLCEQLIKP